MSSALVGTAWRSAWPSAPVDHLLRAIALPDKAEAAAAWRAFEQGSDFESLGWGEFRLVGQAANRIADLAPDSPNRPRIAGIERSLWSRSQLVIREAGSALRALSDADVAIMAVKGAARAAAGDPLARGRVVNDIDLVVAPADVARAYDVLVGDGWVPAGSGTPIFQRTRLGQVSGINLVRSRFGNVDLHRTAFPAPFDDADGDAAMWRRATPGLLHHAAVFVPSPTDAVLVALAHGALDAHKSSDWLMDIVSALDAGVDWDLLVECAGRRRLEAAAAIALGYVDARLGRSVPAGTLPTLEKSASRRPLRMLGTIAEMRPKERGSVFFWFLRAIAKQRRLWLAERKSRTPLIWMSALPARRGQDSAGMALAHPLNLDGRRPGEPWHGRIDVSIAAELPPVWRRVDFEVNAGDRHLLRLRGLARNGGRRVGHFRFRFTLTLASNDPVPVLEAAPSRSFNTDAPDNEVERYAAPRFALSALRVRRTG